MSSSEGGSAAPIPEHDPSTFLEFIRRVRAGDEAAASELVNRYEPALRLEIRLRLLDPQLRRLLDPADVSQSVLKSFFIRATTGQFELDSPQKLMALLRSMARNKVAHQVRKQKAQRRDVRREVTLEGTPVPSADPSPSRVAIGRELLDAFRARLSSEERRMADLRSAGSEWAEISSELGGTPGGRRKQLARALERVVHELGLDGTLDTEG